MKKTLLYLLLLSLTVFFSCSNTKEDDQKNTELVKIENEIYILINDGKLKEALILVGTLSHPSNEDWDSKKKERKILGMEFSWGCYTYQEYWDTRREQIRAEIMDMQSYNSFSSNDYQSGRNNSNTKTIDHKARKKDFVFEDKYLGLYVADQSDDKTQFYKFSKNKDGIIEILYQNNNSGELVLGNFRIIEFNKDDESVILQNIKYPNDKREMVFRNDPGSDNTYKLISYSGIVFKFISK